MKKHLIKIIIGICILLLIVCLIPTRLHLDDGDTVVYKAALYQVSQVHKLNGVSENGIEYLEGTVVIILGIVVYNDVE